MESTKVKIVGVYLAAGSSKRMGTSKLSLELAAGMRLGGIALLQALRSDLDAIVIVTNEANSLDWLPEEAHLHLQKGRCRIEVCEDAALGMALSLRKGIHAAKALGAEAVLVMLADQPFVTTEMLAGLVDRYRREAGCDYMAYGDEGVPKPPVVLGSGMWAHAASLEGDAGARSLFRLPEFRGRVIKESNKVRFMDVDTPELYEEAKKQFAHFLCQFK
ncbi:NTP transferase domain-containing protein [Paenibacillus sp. SI8]|uniref:nucleotidyltransferase family protein n=1 Tax=unclassified Paenibacillus TaxID=185978 RepID=UPI003465FABC